MKRFILVILAVMMAVCLWLGAAAAEEEGILGKPFPGPAGTAAEPHQRPDPERRRLFPCGLRVYRVFQRLNRRDPG